MRSRPIIRQSLTDNLKKKLNWRLVNPLLVAALFLYCNINYRETLMLASWGHAHELLWITIFGIGVTSSVAAIFLDSAILHRIEIAFFELVLFALLTNRLVTSSVHWISGTRDEILYYVVDGFFFIAIYVCFAQVYGNKIAASHVVTVFSCAALAAFYMILDLRVLH